MNTDHLHAYTDKADTIIGTCLEEAVSAYAKENPDFEFAGSQHWTRLDDDSKKTIRDLGDGAEPKETKTIREWIDWHIANNPNHFSRLLCSTEY